MKKKLLILSACIGLILACFPFTLYAEEDPESDLGVSPPPAYFELDNYFWDNYYLLPYIESDGHQYINTGIQASSNLCIGIKFSDVDNSGQKAIFGSVSSGKNLELLCRFSDQNNNCFYFDSSETRTSFEYEPYSIYNFVFNRNVIDYNGNQITINNYSEFSSGQTIWIYGRNNGSDSNYLSSYKLYNFYIYDYSAYNGDGAYVKYYYPAKAISSGTIGLYDAVSKTFVTTLGSVPFESPTDDDVIHFQIGNFITSALGWIDDILDFAISEPVIILFMAIGLAGAMFRWGRRLVHF